MKKDLQWTKNNEQGQKTKDNDKRQRTPENDKKQTFGSSNDKRLLTIENDYSISDHVQQLTNKNDNDKGQSRHVDWQTKPEKNIESRHDNENGHGKQDKDYKKVQNTTPDSRHVSLLKGEINTNSNVTSGIRFIGTESKERTLETLNCIGNEDEKDKDDHKYGKKERTSGQNTFKLHKQKCNKTKKNDKISISNLLLFKTKIKSIYQCMKLGDNFKLFLTLLIFIPVVNSYTIRESRIEITKSETMNPEKPVTKINTVEDIDNDSLTFTDPNTNKTTPCICPTASLTTSGSSTTTQSTSTGTTNSSRECICPDGIQSLAEEETATDMPTMTGRRRRRKEIDNLDLFVDEFDQKILKKMPFLKFY